MSRMRSGWRFRLSLAPQPALLLALRKPPWLFWPQFVIGYDTPSCCSGWCEGGLGCPFWPSTRASKNDFINSRLIPQFLGGGPAAVDRKIGARDLRGIVAAQKQSQGGHL